MPQDRTIVRKVLRTISVPLFICMWSISSLGIVAAGWLIVFNLWYRHRRYVTLLKTVKLFLFPGSNSWFLISKLSLVSLLSVQLVDWMSLDQQT